MFLLFSSAKSVQISGAKKEDDHLFAGIWKSWFDLSCGDFCMCHRDRENRDSNVLRPCNTVRTQTEENLPVIKKLDSPRHVWKPLVQPECEVDVRSLTEENLEKSKLGDSQEVVFGSLSYEQRVLDWLDSHPPYDDLDHHHAKTLDFLEENSDGFDGGENDFEPGEEWINVEDTHSEAELEHLRRSKEKVD